MESRDGKSQRKEEEKKDDQRKENQKNEDAGARKLGKIVARYVLPLICAPRAPEGRKVVSLQRSHLAR